MKIGPTRIPGDPVHLPIEIIENIVNAIASHDDERTRQAHLWSLCLISRDWYSVAIKSLYQTPFLRPRNFDLFIRTLCPPLNSRIRHVGLEDFVTHLHMGDLAYVTSSSMTARLLRKTKKSLVTFEAPSHSMSTSSLAPISKLAVLEHLDLSRDKYDFDIQALLRAVHSLPSLRYLSLPRGALSSYPSSAPSALIAWPPALEYLQANNTAPYYANQWQSFINHLPTTLRTLSFQHLRSDSALAGITDLGAQAPQITTLTIEADEGVDCVRNDDVSLYNLLRVFPGLVKLSIPESVLHYDACFEFAGEGLGESLQDLSFSPVYEPFTSARFDLDQSFSRMVHLLPQLKRIGVSADCVHSDSGALMACASILNQRWTNDPIDSKGIFVISLRGIITPWSEST
jgi:hypothetical protein